MAAIAEESVSELATNFDLTERKYRGVYPLFLFLRFYTQMITIALLLLYIPYVLLLLVLRATDSPFFNVMPFTSFMLAWVNLGVVVAIVGGFFVLHISFWRFGWASGIVGAVLFGYGIVGFSRLIFNDISPRMPAVWAFLSYSPSFAAALLLSTAFGLGVMAAFYWAMFRGVVATFRLRRSDRDVMRDTSVKNSLLSRLVSRIFNLPPTFDYVRWPRARRGLILLLSALCTFAFAAASSVLQGFAMVPAGAFSGEMQAIQNTCMLPQYPTSLQGDCVRYYGSQFGYPWISIWVLPLGLEGALLAVAWASQLTIRRQMLLSLELLTRTDPRPPILFLRAFADDQVPLREPKLSVIGRLFDVGQWRSNLDGVLLEEGTAYGPVVALGNPNDRHPPYGAARGYFDNRTWHESVADLSQRSRAIVLCLDDTDGIWWEIEHLQARAHLLKTLFLVHPKYRAAEANGAIMDKLAHAIGPDDPEVGLLMSSIGTNARAIGLFWDATGRLRILQSSVFTRFSYLLAIRTFLREKLGIQGMPVSA